MKLMQSPCLVSEITFCNIKSSYPMRSQLHSKSLYDMQLEECHVGFLNLRGGWFNLLVFIDYYFIFFTNIEIFKRMLSFI